MSLSSSTSPVLLWSTGYLLIRWLHRSSILTLYKVPTMGVSVIVPQDIIHININPVINCWLFRDDLQNVKIWSYQAILLIAQAWSHNASDLIHTIHWQPARVHIIVQYPNTEWDARSFLISYSGWSCLTLPLMVYLDWAVRSSTRSRLEVCFMLLGYQYQLLTEQGRVPISQPSLIPRDAVSSDFASQLILFYTEEVGNTVV